MCGHVGIINRELTKTGSDRLIKVFNQALYCGALRGTHGTGILGVELDGKAIYYKKAMSSSDFIELTKAKGIINGTNEFLCGHNRFATQGGHTAENSYPFYHGNVVMFHNGTLDSWKWMSPGKTFAVDSECLTYAISKSDDIIKTLESIDGAFSLVWYDTLSKTLNFARNKERPMFFGVVKGTGSIIYASEEGMIEWLAARNGVDLVNVTQTEVGKLISIPLDNKVKVKLTKFIPKVEDLTWNKYYNYPKSEKYKDNNLKTYNIPPSKNDELVGVKEALVDIKSWDPYNETVSNNRWGRLVGTYKGVVIRVASISESIKDKYIGKKVIVNITSATDKEAYGSLIRLADEEDITINQLVDSDDKVKLLSGSKLLCCNNCNDSILPSEIKDCLIEDDGSTYCRDCSTILEQVTL